VAEVTNEVREDFGGYFVVRVRFTGRMDDALARMKARHPDAVSIHGDGDEVIAIYL